MFYEKLRSLCAKNGIFVTKMCQETGLATSAPVRWKSTQRKYSKAKDRLATLFRTDIRSIHISDLNAICADLTYNSAHAVQNLVSKVYQLAMAEQYVAVNLAPLMTLPTDHAETPKMPFAKGEIDTLWVDYRQTKEPVCASILLCIYTGLMPIELLRLTKQDCDLDAGLIDSAVGAKTEKRRTSYVLVPEKRAGIKPALSFCKGIISLFSAAQYPL